MRSVLVTGGAGFIGSNFVRHLLAERPDCRVVNLDALTYAGSLENLRDLPDGGAEAGRHVFVEGSICDRELVDQLLREYDVDTIVHFAAESHVDRSITGPAAFIETNITGTFCLLEAARQAWIVGKRGGARRFHHVSTDEVFGSLAPDDPAFTERHPYQPSSPYSASKAASDHLVRAYVHTYGLDATISNCSNNYGPYQFPEKLIPLMIVNAALGKPLPVYGDGLQVRDWLYVGDHCEAVLAVIERGARGETYNIGGGNQPTNLAVVRRICELLDVRFSDSAHCPHAGLVTYVTDRPGHDRRYAMDISKIERELGWRPKHGFESGLAATVDWYCKNGAWLSAIRKSADYERWIAMNYESRGARGDAT